MKPQSSLKKSSVKAPAERVVKDIRRQTAVLPEQWAKIIEQC